MDNGLITRIEEYVKQAFGRIEGSWYLIAHDFKHVSRVRNRALYLAEREEFGDLQIVGATALLHDIGLAYMENDDGTSNTGIQSPHRTGTKSARLPEHASVGAKIAEKYLRENSDFSSEQIQKITLAVGYHSSPPSLVDDFIKTIPVDSAKLINILRDADIMDAIGAVGLMRAFTSKYVLPEYNPDNIKGGTWGLRSDEFRARYGPGLGSVRYFIDQINQQIRYYENLRTETAKQLSEPLVKFMRSFILQLEHEITTQQSKKGIFQFLSNILI